MFSFNTANFGWEESDNGSTPAAETQNWNLQPRYPGRLWLQQPWADGRGRGLGARGKRRDMGASVIVSTIKQQ